MAKRVSNVPAHETIKTDHDHDSSALDPRGESNRIDVAIVDPDPDQRRLYAYIVKRAGFSVSLAQDATSASELMKTDRPRLVLCAYELPDGDGVDFFRTLHTDPQQVGTYLMLTSCSSTSQLATHALEGWADDYLPKPIQHCELTARVRAGMRIWTMHDQLRNAAITDGLTGLNNHEHFHRVLDMEMARSRRYGHPLSLIMVDLDFFKAINDTFGHMTGNSVLEAVARVLRETVRDVDTVGRVGGEEFAIVLPEARTVDAVDVAERIRKTLPRAVSLETTQAHEVTASFGIADSEDPRVTGTADLVDLADRALYVAKRQGRNRVATACNLSEQVEMETSIETDEVNWLRRRLAVLSARVRDVYVQSVATLLKALDEKDPYSGRHSVNVAFYAEQIAEVMECSRATRKSVYNAALLHDIGKVGVPDSILLKQTPLTPLEHMVIEQVPLIGTRIVDHMRILESEIQIIRHQREYYDGTGVPAGLRGDQIPVGSRVLLTADAFDAMTTDRVYRTRKPVSQVLDEIKKQAKKQFDPAVVAALHEAYHDNQDAWDQRIHDTIQAARMPNDEKLSVAANAFAPTW